MISKLFHSCHVSPRWAEGHVAGHRRCKRRQDLDGYQYIEPTWNDVVEYTYIYILICFKIHICWSLFSVHHTFKEKNALYLLCLYILLILPFYVQDMTLWKPQKMTSHSPPHHVCCSHPPRQIPNVHYLGGFGAKSSSLMLSISCWGFKQQRLAMAISCCVAQM